MALRFVLRLAFFLAFLLVFRLAFFLALRFVLRFAFFFAFFLAFFFTFRFFFLATRRFFGAAFFLVTFRFFALLRLEAFFRDFFFVAISISPCRDPALSIYNKTKKSSNLGDAINSFEKSLFRLFVHPKRKLNYVQQIKKFRMCIHNEKMHDAGLCNESFSGAIE